MDELQEDLKIYSEEVREVLSAPPKAIFKWGNTILFAFIILLGLLFWFIKYPDIISTQIIITTSVPPQKLIAKTSGKIEAILVKDKAVVSKNTPLAVIENTANYKDIFRLSEALSKGEGNLSHFNFEQFKNAQFGDVESAFAIFQKEYTADVLNDKLQPYKVEGRAQSFEVVQLRERLSLLISQKENSESGLALEKIDLDRYESLFKKGIVAAQELEKHQLSYLQSERNYKNLLSSISQLKSSLNDLDKSSKTTKINESKENVNLERNVIQAFYQLKKAIKDWELNYVLRSAIDGKITFLQVWTENQTVNSGDNIFAIIPSHENGYIGKVKAPAQNSGKLKEGQDVNIRLSTYPDREFGILRGKVKTISLTPDKEGNLLIDISLPNGLKTSYKKQLAFRQEMLGTADIVTEDLRLIERILYQFRDIFKPSRDV